MIDADKDREGLAWQTGVWNRISDIYLREIDQRFAPVAFRRRPLQHRRSRWLRSSPWAGIWVARTPGS